jgi:hypothetical protein
MIINPEDKVIYVNIIHVLKYSYSQHAGSA